MEIFSSIIEVHQDVHLLDAFQNRMEISFFSSSRPSWEIWANFAGVVNDRFNYEKQLLLLTGNGPEKLSTVLTT